MKPLALFLNRVIQSDCVHAMPLMPSGSIDLVVTDPPFLVNYRPRDGRRCAGDKSNYWLKPAFRELYRVLKRDAFCATFYGWPWIDEFMSVWKQCGFRPVSHLAWPKSYSSYDGYTQGFHEVGFLLAKGHPPKPEKPIPDTLPWEYTGNKLHPNQKPVTAITPLIEAFSKPGDTVLDPFCGSGTTGVAAKLCNRRFVLIEKVWRHYWTAQNRLKRVVREMSAIPRN